MTALSEAAIIEVSSWQRTSPALERATEQMSVAIRRAAIMREKEGARIMLNEPFRIQRAIYGETIYGEFHARIGRLKALAKRRVEAMQRLGKAGHWTFDANRLVACREAYLALRVMSRAKMKTIYDVPAAPDAAVLGG